MNQSKELRSLTSLCKLTPAVFIWIPLSCAQTHLSYFSGSIIKFITLITLEQICLTIASFIMLRYCVHCSFCSAVQLYKRVCAQVNTVFRKHDINNATDFRWPLTNACWGIDAPFPVFHTCYILGKVSVRKYITWLADPFNGS